MIRETTAVHRSTELKKGKRVEMKRAYKRYLDLAETRKKIRRPLIRLIFSRIGVIGVNTAVAGTYTAFCV